MVSLGANKAGYHQAFGGKHEVTDRHLHIKLDKTGIIRGRVLGFARKKPGEKISIDARAPGNPIGKWGGGTTCKPDGTFEFKNVPAGRYILQVDENEPEKTIILNSGEVVEVELELE